MNAEENLQRMKTLDDAWNPRNGEVFRKRHSADAKVYWRDSRTRRAAGTRIIESRRRSSSRSRIILTTIQLPDSRSRSVQ